MANKKYGFKLLLLLQLLALTYASFRDPDAEFIDFAAFNHPSRDHMIIQAAVKRGMDGGAVAELLHTREPVVRTTLTPDGFTKTTTYKLEPDGSISSKSILQKRNRYVYNSDSIPDDLKNSPTGTVTRTFTDNAGNKVTQTIAVNNDKSRPADEADDLNGDWFGKPFVPRPQDGPGSHQFSTNHRTVSRTFTSPNGERTTVQRWSSEPETPFTFKNNMPNFRRTSTRTFTTKPNGEKHRIQTTSTNEDSFNINHKPQFPPIEDMDWPNFDDPAFPPDWNDMKSETDDDGWELIDDPEVTTKKNIKSWTPKTWQWPEFPTHPTTTTTTTTTPTSPTLSTHKPLPSLDDFLKSQYGPPSKREPTTSTAKTVTSTTKYKSTTTPKSSNTTPKFIQIEDLPVVEILHNGKPADESLLKTLPAHLTPRTPNETILSIEHKHPVEEDMDSYTPKVEKNIRSYSKTHIGPEKPRLKDLDPQMQDILNNAGIVPEIEGDAITKTRTEPDGRIITTTYKVNTVPVAPIEYTPIHEVRLQPLVPHLSPIGDFLARLGLSMFDLTSQNGHYSKTIIDENGDVLTATFVLTSASKKAGGRK